VTALAALAGAGAAAGLFLLVLGLTGNAPSLGPARAERSRPTGALLAGTRRRVALALVGGVIGLLVTRWPVGVLIGAATAAALPGMLGQGRARRRAIAKVEAIAVWTEMLRDMMAAASGLEEAIVATARTAVVPEPIRPEVTALAARLSARWPFRAALQAFGDELADPSADKVVVALALAREQRVRHLGEMLSALARSTRGHVSMRLRVETERAKSRASARFITIFSLSMVALLLIFSRGYLEPFGSPLGQLVLLVIAGIFTGAFVWMGVMQRERPALRLRLTESSDRVLR
jgi:hypothetical protein